MANKRHFKKSIEELGSSISFQLIYLSSSNNDIKKEVTDKSVNEILDAIVLAKKRANQFYGSKKDSGFKKEDKLQKSRAKKVFFKELFADIKKSYSESINSALKQFNEALPETIKETNKANA